MEDEDDFFIEASDLPYEEDIIRNPYTLKPWLRYVTHKQSSQPRVLNLIYERALKQLPGSYKLWYTYLKLRRTQARQRPRGDPLYEEANSAHERALVFMHKMPRIWLDYCTFLMHQNLITRTRRALDRALRGLPITQHERVWTVYLKFIERHAAHIPDTALRVYRRYVKFAPECMEKFVDFLLRQDNLDEAALRLVEVINNEEFVSKNGRSKHELWHQLCQLVCKNPLRIISIQPDPIIRQGIKKYTDQRGSLWNSLAEYYIRSGNIPRARDVYEEAMATVVTRRDFVQIYDAYLDFEETLLKRKMDMEDPTEEEELDIALGLTRTENLVARRALLENSVVLRQNPHNIEEWLRRVKLHEEKGPRAQIEVFAEAVKTVEPAKASFGQVSSLWVEFGKFYESHKQLRDARVVFEEATSQPFTRVEDLVAVWTEWVEMEVRHDNFDEALRLLGRATAVPARKVDYYDRSEPVQNRVHKSTRLWSLYADLEESFGTLKTTKAVYDRMIDLRISTPLIILNYATFLEENKYFEEAFKAYEKGVSLFKWPNVYDIWKAYITKFLARYGGTKLERARDLFEQCLEHCPKDYSRHFYLLYAKLEEEHGLAQRAMKIYERATKGCKDEDKAEMYITYIKRVSDLLGVTHTRPIFEEAIQVLPERQSKQMCLRFADMERKLGEIDRARALYSYCSQMCDPRTEAEFWLVWKDFELAHGNEDTLREMARIKRSVQATYNTQTNYMAAQMMATAAGAPGASGAAAGGANAAATLLATGEMPQENVANEMQRLEAEATAANTQRLQSKGQLQFVSAGISQINPQATAGSTAKNPEMLDLDATSSSEEEEEDLPQKQSIPTEVFGGLKRDEDEEKEMTS